MGRLRAARAVFLDAATLGDDVDWAGLEAATDRLERHAHTPPESVQARLQGASVAITNKVRIDAALMAALPELQLVLVTATGVDNVDLEAAARHRITVANCRDYGTSAVAQHTLMLMLALHARLLEYQARLAAGAWQRAQSFCLADLPIRELAGARLGIVGRGAIGRAVAERARSFGMTVRFAQLPDRPAGTDTLPWRELLGQIDVLSLHCPLNAATRHLVNRDVLAVLRPGAFLVNTARAGLVEPHALLDALRSGQLAGAAFDGLEVEPPPDDDPLLAAGLPNLLITPHHAWASREARQRIIGQTAENLLAWRRGTAVRAVSPPR